MYEPFFSGAEEINYSEFLAATLQTRMALNDQLIREAFERCVSTQLRRSRTVLADES